MFPFANQKNERSFYDEGALASLLDLLASLEDAAARAHASMMADPTTVKANGAAFAAFANVCGSFPEYRASRSTVAVGDTVEGLGDDYPHALLAATRTGWIGAVANLIPMAIARGANPMAVTTELTALQAALASEPAPKLAPTRRELVWTEGCARLWKLRGGRGTPTVVVSSFINRYYLLDLLAGQSLIEGIGGPVYLLDWTVGTEDLEGVLDRLATTLDRFKKVKLFGYSMGGTLATIHAARHPDRVARLAVFGTPIDASKGGSFAVWTEQADFEAISGAFSAVPAPWVHAPFWALRPTVNLLKLTQLVRRWRQDGYLERFLAVELWNNDNVDFASPLYQSWGDRIYRDNALWTGELAKLEDIRCPVLAVAAVGDGIVPAACTLALADRVPDGTAVQVPSGHVGALSGRKGLKQTTEAIAGFLGGK